MRLIVDNFTLNYSRLITKSYFKEEPLRVRFSSSDILKAVCNSTARWRKAPSSFSSCDATGATGATGDSVAASPRFESTGDVRRTLLVVAMRCRCVGGDAVDVDDARLVELERQRNKRFRNRVRLPSPMKFGILLSYYRYYYQLSNINQLTLCTYSTFSLFWILIY